MVNAAGLATTGSTGPADAALNSALLVRAGVLTESCDHGTATCDDNQKQFKGIFMRYLMDLADATGSVTHGGFARVQAYTNRPRLAQPHRPALGRPEPERQRLAHPGEWPRR